MTARRVPVPGVAYAGPAPGVWFCVYGEYPTWPHGSIELEPTLDAGVGYDISERGAPHRELRSEPSRAVLEADDAAPPNDASGPPGVGGARLLVGPPEEDMVDCPPR